ncbi:MAG: hypothetical protein QXL27_09110 [Candidatus Bathyarchaeia archaeon]
MESPIGDGKFIDIVVDKRIAIEVETGESDVEVNVKKLIEAKFKKSTIVCGSSSVKKSVEKCVKLYGKGITVLEINGLQKLPNLIGLSDAK